MRHRYSHKEIGAAIVELALIFPLVLVIGFAGVEFARVFKVYEAMSTVSREAARIPLVQCEQAPDFEVCMNSNAIFTKLQAFTSVALPGCEIIVSAYDRVVGAGGATVILAGRLGMPQNLALLPNVRFETPNLRQVTRFSTAYFNINVGTSDSLLFDYTASVPPGPAKNRMIAGEVFCPITALSPLAFLFRPRTDVLYDSTLY